MIYAKLINDKLIYAPNPVNIDGKFICNPTREQYSKIGYLPIIEEEIKPEQREIELLPDGMMKTYYWKEKWDDVENFDDNGEKYIVSIGSIIKVCELIPVPDPEQKIPSENEILKQKLELLQEELEKQKKIGLERDEAIIELAKLLESQKNKEGNVDG